MDLPSIMATMIGMELNKDDPKDDDLIRFQCGDGIEFKIPFKIFKMWTGAVKLMHHPFRSFQGMVQSSSSLTWIIVWSRKHQDDEPDPSVDGPNYGITSIDDIPDWDKQLMSKMSDDFFDSVSRCAIHLGVKPLVKLLTKETFCRFPDTVAVESISHASPLQWLNMPPVLVYNPAIRSDYRSRNIDFRCDDGSKVANCPVKAMMKWRSVSKFFITPDDGDDCILNRLDVLRRIPKAGMKWIIKWGKMHEDDPDIDDVSGLDNLGITDIDVTNVDMELFKDMTRDEMKMALRDCSRLNLQPLIIVLLKMMFKMYNLKKVVMKDVRDLSKKISIFNPTIKRDEVD